MAEITFEESTNDRLVNLVTLGSKEASLDSPSFRACINHFHTQVLILEKWIQENTKVGGKDPRTLVSTVEKLEDSLLSRLLPPPSYLSNGLVESKGYTPWIVNEFQEALKNFAIGINSFMLGNPETYLSTYLDILVQVVKPYKELRENFDYYQGRYDSFIKSYNERKNIPVKNSESLRDQAFELFQIRKLYLNSSLLLISGICVTQLKLDEMLSNLIEMTVTTTQQIKTSQYVIKVHDDLKSDFSHYRKWINAMLSSSKEISEDYERTENRLKQFCYNTLEPSSELSDYDIEAIDSSNLVSTAVPKSTTKKGWLFLRTTLGEDGRSTWLKRYCFVQEGLFGMLMLSPSKTYVEESDKFGILLISATFNRRIDRRFCFDVEISRANDSAAQKNTILTFQAESLVDLKEWLTCFHYAKIEASKVSSTQKEYTILRSRISPRFKEFACTSTTKVDFQTTSIRENYTQSLLELIKANPSSFSDYAESEATLCRTPILTQITRLSIIANQFVGNTNFPNAITANIWGCADINQIFRSSPIVGNPLEELRWNPKVYSSLYPQTLKDNDVLAKALFSGTFPQSYANGDLLLMKESCICSLMNGRGYPTTLFLTSSKLYFYVNFMGFVYMTYLDLDLISSLQVVAKSTDTEEGTIKIHESDGFIVTIRVFFSNPYCFCEKILLILENEANKKETKAENIVEKFAQIDATYKNSSDEKASQTSSQLLTRGLKTDRVKLLQRQQEFQLAYDSNVRIDVDAPPRALMYLVFGDKSKLFQDILSITDLSSRRHMVGFWCMDVQTSTIVRKAKFRLSLSKAFVTDEQLAYRSYENQGFMDIVQRISKVEDDFYYEVDQFSGYFSIPLTKLFKIHTKYIIINRDTGAPVERYTDLARSTSSLYVYYNIIFVDKRTLKASKSLNFIDKAVKSLLLSVSRNESKVMKIILHSYINRLGKNAKILKAMRLGGQIGVYQGTELPQGDFDAERIENKVIYTTGLLFKVMLRWSLFFWSRLCINVLKFIFSIFYGLITNLRMLNRLVLSFLIISLFCNAYLVQKATFEYWALRKAENVANSVVNIERYGMERTLYLSDLDILTSSLTEKNILVQKFLGIDTDTRKKYQTLRYEIALRRNELLVELSILNNVEKELIQGDFRKFLVGEVQMCNTVQDSHPSIFTENKELKAYCELCCSQLNAGPDLL